MVLFFGITKAVLPSFKDDKMLEKTLLTSSPDLEQTQESKQ
jgi:hypothetical protein